jgi:hypothetical protein
VADENDVAAVEAPLTPGTTQVVWQLAAVELHLIMQFVTVEVTVDVCGVIGVGDCAKAVPAAAMADASTAATATTIVMRRMIVSTNEPPRCKRDGCYHTHRR